MSRDKREKKGGKVAVLPSLPFLELIYNLIFCLIKVPERTELITAELHFI